jgi:CO/xanthine dehydrogenase FAD-binding subunit
MDARVSRLGAMLATCLLLIIGLAIWMNSDYSRISDRGYDYALALVSACSRQDEIRVKQIAEEIVAAELPVYDRRVILKIAENALSGNWRSASDEARTLLKAQIQPAD